LVDITEKIILKKILTNPKHVGIITKFLVVTTGRITFMENQLTDVDLKDSIIDRMHYLSEMGDYMSACAIYNEFRETILNKHVSGSHQNK
jgi:hypothetical protein